MWSGRHQAHSHINSYNSKRLTTSRLCGEGLQANGTSKPSKIVRLKKVKLAVLGCQNSTFADLLI